jgi:uncharacterized membrane protein
VSRNNDNPVFLYVATYDNQNDAKTDFDALGQLRRDGLIGLYDAALVTRDYDDKVHIRSDEKPTQRGAAMGLGLGSVAGWGISAIIGAFFPPYLLAGAALGAIDGAVIGHLRDGLPRKDLKELGETLNDGTAAVVLLAESTVKEAAQKAVKRASKEIEKEITGGAKELNRDIDTIVDAATTAS